MISDMKLFITLPPPFYYSFLKSNYFFVNRFVAELSFGSEIFSVNSCAPFLYFEQAVCILFLHICLNAREESVQRVCFNK